MTREEAIRHIRDVIAENNSIKPNIVTFEQEKEALYIAIEALQDDWIPVNNDSVVPNHEVICQDRYGNMMLGYAWVDEYGIWVCEDDNTMMDDVIAWRPLPKPYKEIEQC